uniref:Uncharacterized protein n=2 Tax=Cucumis sativus TaxID=3659 RepID=A0A0A0KLM0_CUCSA
MPNVDVVPAAATPPAIFYCVTGSYCRGYVSYSCSAFCPSCSKNLSQACRYVTPPKAGNQPAPDRGFVKDLATYIVTDDLTVKHISDFSITTLLKKFNIKDVDSLEEKVITLDVNEGVELLEASLQSKTVLTNAFLKRRRSHIDNDVKLSGSLSPSV